MTPKQGAVKSMTPVLLPILYSAVECRVKNNFYLLRTRVTLSQKRLLRKPKMQQHDCGFYGPAIETA
jgi:hypothetical protein